jgi:hypothetical protein
MTRIIRTLALPEIATLLDWAAAEGWNPGLDDAVAFQAADPSGFFGAFVDGVMVAGIAAVAYDAAFGFIGLYICHPDWRGQGHGKAVWDAGMAYLGERTIGLDGVPEQQAHYVAMGFVPAYETIRMSGTLASDQTSARQIPPAAIVEEIRDLDRECFPARRDDFLRAWLASPNQGMVHRGDGIVDGYAVLRPCRSGAKVGPLFARDMSVALELLATVSGPVQTDVPAIQTDWLEALATRGLEPGFRTKRMYRGDLPSVRLDRVFGVSSLELG